MMRFESLGGDQHGCEFGLFQRALGVEPISLLRWTSVSYDALVTLLETDFQGVGEPEFIQLDRFGSPAEWKTSDPRFFMWMRTFIIADEIPAEKMLQTAARRMQFLRRKIIADLAAGEKIFGFRNMARDLTDGEIDRLHAAMRRYGDNTLLYVRYADSDHTAGLVEMPAPGLLVGYLDSFWHTPRVGVTGPITVHKEWLALCRAAYELTVPTGDGR